ncbi:NUDIX hydrolase [Malaciobacter molluscorum LMG 25693]|uniref:Diadenosine tetraphosphate hydrolase n=1 Tax=Malaciobacter molluscorum LMG 25693 TaxID=870501 RepID=A0A2G1DFV2_9BACT|nr:NUDIX domain-containing protein [Malaciobacter molluscorum]AXX91743.1 putative diadenosine tetraphosphate hydrolase [Malaciobacter molluscorum LMG 25693]PHO17369.1 NUDIX hydrolase [Malaciobacter molluscorum LMG 25693]RXJ92797.1 NUDIX hydrolase [Malaciobacter molluscorum]
MPNNHVKAYGIALYKLENNNSIKLLLCKSSKSENRWGFLKGMQQKAESAKECAKREFLEESGIKVDIDFFEEYFEQINKEKDIGIWLVNAKNIKDLDIYFNDEGKIFDKFISPENSKVKYFDLNKLPQFKKKQKNLIVKIKGFLENKNQHH